MSNQDRNIDAAGYAPSSARAGVSSWMQMARVVWQSRELTRRLFVRQVAARYRQTVLRYVWAIVPPVVVAATFSGLTRADLLAVDPTPLPYPVFVLLGMTVWQLFAVGVSGAADSLVGATALVSSMRFPREALVLAALGQSIVEFVIRSALVGVALVMLDVTPAWTVILVPLALIPLCLLTLGLGFLLALANDITRDVGHVLRFGLTFWMLLTPVVYPPPTSGTRTLINVLNPVSPFVIAAQDLVSRGQLSQPSTYAVCTVLAATLCLCAWRLFHLSEHRIVERL